MDLSENQIKSQNLDHLGVVASTIDELGIIEKIDSMLPLQQGKGVKTTMGERVAAMILNGLGFVDDRLYIFPKFLEEKPVERLLRPGLCAEYFNESSLGRCLDKIYEYGTSKFFSEIAIDLAIRHKLMGKSLHADTTSLSLFGDYEIEEDKEESETKDKKEKESIPVPTHGYSKDHRPDLKQVVLELTTTGKAGFPIWMESHSGNASDKTIIFEAIKKMEAVCKDIKECENFIAVGDSAMYERCLEDDSSTLWLSRVPERHKKAKEMLELPDNNFTWYELEDGYKIYVETVNYREIKQRWCLVYSQHAYERESKTLDKKVKKEKDEATKLVKKMQKKVFSCKEDALKQLGEKDKLKYHKIVGTVESEIKYKRPGKPSKNSEQKTVYYINYVIEELPQEIEKVRNKKGRFILATNQLCEKDLPDKDILPTYKEQSKVERGFKFLKSNTFEVSSVFLKKPKRIAALMVVMTLCLMVYGFAEYMFRKKLLEAKMTIPNQKNKEVSNPSMSWVFRLLLGIHVVRITVNDKVQKIVSNLNDVRRKIIRIFGGKALQIYG